MAQLMTLTINGTSKTLDVEPDMKLGSDESFYNRMIYEVLTDLSAAIKRDLQRYRRP